MRFPKIIRIINCMLYLHHWKYADPDPSVGAQDWSGHEYSVVCVNCGAMDYKKAPK